VRVSVSERVEWVSGALSPGSEGPACMAIVHPCKMINHQHLIFLSGIAACYREYKMTFSEMTKFGDLTFGEVTFGEMTFGEMAFGDLTQKVTRKNSCCRFLHWSRNPN